jgi:hypothetical protein
MVPSPSLVMGPIWSLIDSKHKETNFTKRLKIQGLKMRSKRIINNSPRRGRNKVTEGNHVLI